MLATVAHGLWLRGDALTEDLERLLHHLAPTLRCRILAGEQLLPEGKRVIVRMEGTNKERGLEIIHSLGNRVSCVDSIPEGVEALRAVYSAGRCVQ
jgi:succinyl-CoA synthetase beta subunit